MNINKIIQRYFVEYGFTKSKLLLRLSGKNAPKILLNSIPKAGTNLLIRSLYLMNPFYRKLMRTINNPNLSSLAHKLKKLKPGQIAVSHLYYNPERQEIINRLQLRHIFLIRDPRDIAVSSYIYITYKDKNNRLHKYYSKKLQFNHERLLSSIEGVDGNFLPDGKSSTSIIWRIKKYLGWLEEKECLVIRFEDLIGEKGGGDNWKQIETIKKIQKYLGMNFDEKEIPYIANSIFYTDNSTQIVEHFTRGK
jgi:hypothetical protein